MRAKFLVTKVSPVGDSGTEEVQLSAVYGGETNAEDNQFSAATPSGNLNMHISNPGAIGVLKPGQKYYLDFTLAEEAPAPAAPTE